MPRKTQQKTLPSEHNRFANSRNGRRNYRSPKDIGYNSQDLENEDARSHNHKSKQEHGKLRYSFIRNQFKRSGSCDRNCRTLNNRYNGGRGSNFYEEEKSQNFKDFNNKSFPLDRALEPPDVSCGWQYESTNPNVPIRNGRCERKNSNTCHRSYSNDFSGQGKLKDTSCYSSNNRGWYLMNEFDLEKLNKFVFLVDSPYFKGEILQRNDHITENAAREQLSSQNSNYSTRHNGSFDPRRSHSTYNSSWCYTENTHSENRQPHNKVHSNTNYYARQKIQENYHKPPPTSDANETYSYPPNETLQTVLAIQIEAFDHQEHPQNRNGTWKTDDYHSNEERYRYHQPNNQARHNYLTKSNLTNINLNGGNYSNCWYAKEGTKSVPIKKNFNSSRRPKTFHQRWFNRTIRNKRYAYRSDAASKNSNISNKDSKPKDLKLPSQGKGIESKTVNISSNGANKNCHVKKPNMDGQVKERDNKMEDQKYSTVSEVDEKGLNKSYDFIPSESTGDSAPVVEFRLTDKEVNSLTEEEKSSKTNCESQIYDNESVLPKTDSWNSDANYPEEEECTPTNEAESPLNKYSSPIIETTLSNTETNPDDEAPPTRESSANGYSLPIIETTLSNTETNLDDEAPPTRESSANEYSSPMKENGSDIRDSLEPSEPIFNDQDDTPESST